MRKVLVRCAVAFTAVVILGNILFWILVGVNFSPVRNEYERGRILRFGPAVLVFGHGDWVEQNSVTYHRTIVRDGDSTLVLSTLTLVKRLHAEGARWIWGTWCYSGDRPFIARDMVAGRELPWPSYVSRNETPGRTWPIWLGFGFYRASIGGPETPKPEADLMSSFRLWTRTDPAFYWP